MKKEEYLPQTIREIICKGCQNVIAQVFDEQLVQAGNMRIYNSFRPICICGKPSAKWCPSDIEIDESYQSRLDFQRTILRSLADNEKFKKQKKIK
jgi:hypothetical protein